ALYGQGLDPAALLRPPTDSWPSFNGDYTGRRYSTLLQIDRRNVGTLGMAWAFQTRQQAAIKSTPLLVNGVLYFSAPDHVWAVDARTGREIWHYFWRTRGGIHIGNRGVGMYGNWLYFLTPDNYFVSLDATTGKERWHHEIASIK